MMTKKQQEQLYNRNGFSKSSSLQLSSASFRSFYGHNKWLWTTALLFGLLIVNASAIDEKLDKNSLKSSQASTPASSLSSRDEIYIDDEGLEGSGRGGPHDDLEKDHDFSGSGFGPDDEDSDIYSHHSHTHNTDLGKANRKQKIDFNSNSNNNNNNNNNNDDDFTISRNNNQQNLGASFGGSSGNSNSNNNQGLNTGTIGSGSDSSSGSATGSNTGHTIDNNQNNQNSNAKNPSPEHHPDNTGADNDDFDLDENFPDNEDDRLLPAGSGNGPITDDDTEDSDDDGDDGDILTAHKYPDLGGSSTPKEDRKPIYDDFIEEGGDNDLDKTHKADDDEEDADAEGDNDEGDNNENDNQDNDDEDADDDDDGDDDDSEVGTEFYTDITEHGVGSSSSSSSSSSTTSTSSSSGSSSTTEKRPGGINTQGGTHDLDTNSINSLPPETKIIEQTTGNEVSIMNANDDDRTASFFAQPGILAAVIGGAVVGLLCAILVVMFIVYRMRKKDEGSYALDEPKRSPAMNSYAKNGTNREFYA